MLVGYVRVSSEEQNEERQLQDMKRLGVEKIFVEKVSGKSRDREELEKALIYCREGDKLVVSEISRLGRNARDIHNIMYELEQKDVAVYAIAEGIDSSTDIGKLIIGIMASLAEMERKEIKRRQAAGIEIAKSKGIYKGRKPVEKPIDSDIVFRQVKSGEISSVKAMRHLGLKKSTYYKFYRAFIDSLNNENR